MKTCEQTSRIGAFLDGEMTADECERMATHVAACPVCASEVRQFERISRAIGEMELPVVEAQFVASLHEKVEAVGSVRRMTRLVESLTALAAGVAIAVSVSNSGSSASTPRLATTMAPWEQAAISPGSMDASPAQSDAAAMANWMVTDLSAGGNSRE